MAWSSYAHLPNDEEEYREILSGLEDDMTVSTVDEVIAGVKGKEKVGHHYRNNLVRLGLFDVADGKILLHYAAAALATESGYLKRVLKKCLEQSESMEITEVQSAILRAGTYETAVVARCLSEKYPSVEERNFIRWVRPLIHLFQIVDLLSDRPEQIFEEAYFHFTDRYGVPVALEDMDGQLRIMNSVYDMTRIVEKICSSGLKFQIQLLMLPDWATQHKPYLIYSEYYTHVKIKTSLTGGGLM